MGYLETCDATFLRGQHDSFSVFHFDKLPEVPDEKKLGYALALGLKNEGFPWMQFLSDVYERERFLYNKAHQEALGFQPWFARYAGRIAAKSIEEIENYVE